MTKVKRSNWGGTEGGEQRTRVNHYQLEVRLWQLHASTLRCLWLGRELATTSGLSCPLQPANPSPQPRPQPPRALLLLPERCCSPWQCPAAAGRHQGMRAGDPPLFALLFLLQSSPRKAAAGTSRILLSPSTTHDTRGLSTPCWLLPSLSQLTTFTHV